MEIKFVLSDVGVFGVRLIKFGWYLWKIIKFCLFDISIVSNLF